MSKNDIQKQLHELIKLAEYDLKVREELDQKGELYKGYHPRMKKVHEDNLLILESFLSQYEWPKPSLYGKEAFNAAWMISIHAIDKKKQMKEALIACKKLLDEGEDISYEYCSLYDRISLYEGRKQLYGTQLFPSSNGCYAYNLEDKDQANKLRTDLGLPTIEAKILEFNNDNQLGIISLEEQENLDIQFQQWLNNSE